MKSPEVRASLNGATKQIIRNYVDRTYSYAVQGYRDEMVTDLTDLVERCIYADTHMNGFGEKEEQR